jgi:hypothetical protein
MLSTVLYCADGLASCALAKLQAKAIAETATTERPKMFFLLQTMMRQ